MKIKFKRYLKEYTRIAIGTALVAVGLNLFLVPNKISSGGVSSIGTVLLHFLKVPLSATNIVFNGVLLVFGFRFLGKTALVKTLAGIALLSLFLQLTAYLPFYTEDLLISTLAGGLLLGTGLGLAIRQGASTGGSDFAAMILHRSFPHISVATFILIIDCIILLIAALVFQSITVGCYSLLALFISTRVADGILTLGNTAKAVHVFSKRHPQIAALIIKEFRRGVTGLHSRGLYTNTEGFTLLCVVTPKELPRLVQRIKELDPAAFLVISDAKEVLGEGFKS